MCTVGLGMVSNKEPAVLGRWNHKSKRQHCIRLSCPPIKYMRLLAMLLLCCAMCLCRCAAVLQPLWEELAGPFKTAVDSFRLVPTTRDYIPPDQNPWCVQSAPGSHAA